MRVELIDFSIIVPVFNSQESLEIIYDEVNSLMLGLNKTFELIYVEDNGKPASWAKLLEIKKKYPSTVSIIKLAKNFGQNGATMCGIDMAKGNIIITIDDDLQISPSELIKLINFQKENNSDVIFGIYKNQHVSTIKKIGAAVVKQIFLKSEGSSSIGSSCRLINSNIAHYLKKHSQDHLFINQIISWYTSDINYVEINHNKRFEGKSGYSFSKLLIIGLRLIFFYSSIPLKIMISLCIICSLLSFGLAWYYVYQNVVSGEGIGFLVIISVAISLVLASISIMGIYLNRIYSSRVKQPTYAIKILANDN